MSESMSERLVREARELERLIDAARNGQWEELADGLRGHDRRLRDVLDGDGEGEAPPNRLDLERLLTRNRELEALVRSTRMQHEALVDRVRAGRKMSARYGEMAAI